ncbi:MAG TPA: CBS domain-containing protein [Polyangia bacterium]|nr:CBS domain-containing protein [Polyangia bacterium]
MKLAAHTEGGDGPAAREEGLDGGGGVGARGLEESFVAGAAQGGPGLPTAGEAGAARVGSAMSTAVITVDPLCRAEQALAIAERHDIAHLPVAWSDGELLGIVCVCDLWPLASDDLVVHAMSLPLVTVGASETLARAAELMRENDVGSLPVLDEQQIFGMLTVGDLARAGALAIDELPRACMSCGSRHHVRVGVPIRTARSSAAFCLRCLSRGDGELSTRERAA